MLLRIRTLGDIKEGDLYVKVNGTDYRVFPNKEYNNNLCYEGTLEIPAKSVYEIIVRLEKDGIVMAEYDIGVEQNQKEFRETEYVNFNYLNPNQKARMGWLYEYCAPICSFVGQTELQSAPHEAFKGLQHLEKVYNYYEKNNKDAKLLKLAIEIVKEYAGWEGIQ